MMQKREDRSSGAICMVITTAYYVHRLKLYATFICGAPLNLWYLCKTPSDRCRGHAEPKTTAAPPAWPLMRSSDTVNLKDGEDH